MVVRHLLDQRNMPQTSSTQWLERIRMVCWSGRLTQESFTPFLSTQIRVDEDGIVHSEQGPRHWGGARGAIAPCNCRRHENFDFFFGLNLAKRLYKMTDNLSITLHDKAKALNVSKTLKGMRNKLPFSNLWETITKLARGIADLDEALHDKPLLFCPREHKWTDHEIWRRDTVHEVRLYG